MNEIFNRKKSDRVFILKKKYIILLLAVLVLVFTCSVIKLSDDKSEEVTLFYSANNQGAVATKGIKPMNGIMNGKSMSSAKYSVDKTEAAVLMSVNSEYSLYYTDGKRFTLVSDSSTNNYVISLNGKKIAYYDSSDNLSIFDADKNKNTQIDNQVGSFVLSPSGEAVVYTKKTETTEKLYLYSKSKSMEIGEGYVPLTVSDDLNYIYVLGSDNSLCVLNKDGNMKSKICSSVEISVFCFSADMESVVFCDGSYTYVSHLGKSRIRLVPNSSMPIEKNNVNASCDSQQLTKVFKSLTDRFYVTDNVDSTKSLFYIYDDCSKIDIADNVKKYNITEKDSIVYLDDLGKIYRFNKGKSSLLVSSASDMVTDSKGKYIYYIDSSLRLSVFVKDGSALLAEGIRNIYITNDNLLLIVQSDGKLYSVKKDKDIQFVDENVYGCICNKLSTFYVKNYSSQTGNFELYASRNDGRFEKIFDNISNII